MKFSPRIWDVDIIKAAKKFDQLFFFFFCCDGFTFDLHDPSTNQLESVQVNMASYALMAFSLVLATIAITSLQDPGVIRVQLTAQHLHAAQASNPARNASTTVEGPLGVVCAMFRDENSWNLVEWIQFHLLVGATKIVLYDDNSTVSPRELVQQFGDSVVLHTVFAMDDIPRKLLQPGRQQYVKRKTWVLNHCGRTYGSQQDGWLAVVDVDEFLFPCDRAAQPTLWDAFQQDVTPALNGTRVECLKFGFNDLGRSLKPPELQLQYHTHR